MSSFPEAWQVAAPIEGWLTYAQGQRLYDAAGRLKPGALAVEIGSHHGKSAVIIASSLTNGANLIAIDPFDDPRWGGGSDSLAAFEANLERGKVGDRVEFVRGLSSDVIDRWPSEQVVDMLYIDGAHDYLTVSHDITTWGSQLAEGASLFIHDAFSSTGVTRAVIRHLSVNRNFDYRGAAGSLVEFRRSRANLLRKILLAGRLAYFFRNVGVKLALRQRWNWLRRACLHDTTEFPY